MGDCNNCEWVNLAHFFFHFFPAMIRFGWVICLSINTYMYSYTKKKNTRLWDEYHVYAFNTTYRFVQTAHKHYIKSSIL